MQILQLRLTLLLTLLRVVHLHVMLLQLINDHVGFNQFLLCLVELSHSFKALLALIIFLLGEEEDWVLDDEEEGYCQQPYGGYEHEENA